ncbi:MAG: class I SAM-dependent methyltransferase [Rhodospirillaceae bacterium]|nr:MAG: class I SAM-dependent methyltransferase [Rhodospirillaceae bacterium]
MTRATHHDLVASQFGTTAAAYVASSVHASGADLDQLEGLVLRTPRSTVLDLGCGSGHVSLRLAQWVAQVTAYDLADGMLDAVRREASRLGRNNIVCQRGPVESLPFADATFDVVVSRFSVHHWHDVAAGLRDARRVLKPGGQAAFADVTTPGRAVFDTWLQSLELLRDPSHGRNLSVDEWRQALATAGFVVTETTTRRLRLDFPSWVARMGTPDIHVQALRSLHGRMPQEAADYFQLEADGSFTVDTMVMIAV